MPKHQYKRRTTNLLTPASIFSSSKSRMPSWGMPFAVLFGILAFAGGIAGSWHSLFLLTHGISTTGTVSNLESTRTMDNFDVTFLTSYGQCVTAPASKSIGFELYQDGSVVPVLYNPSDPHDVAVDTFSALWFWQLSLILFGAAVTVFYGIATYELGKHILRQRQISKQKLTQPEPAEREVKPRTRRRRPARAYRSKLNRS